MKKTYALRRLKKGQDHYININDFQELLRTYLGRLGYYYSYSIVNTLLKILEEAKMPTQCDDCKQETYCIYPVPINNDKEIKFVCDICYDKKYRCDLCKKDKIFCEEKHK